MIVDESFLDDKEKEKKEKEASPKGRDCQLSSFSLFLTYYASGTFITTRSPGFRLLDL